MKYYNVIVLLDIGLAKFVSKKKNLDFKYDFKKFTTTSPAFKFILDVI